MAPSVHFVGALLLLLYLPCERALSFAGGAPRHPAASAALASSRSSSRLARVPLGVRLSEPVSEIESLLNKVEVEADADEGMGGGALAKSAAVPTAEAAAEPEPETDPLDGLADGKWEMSSNGSVQKLRVAVGGKLLTFESGKMARLASAAVTVTAGDTNVFCAATIDRSRAPKPIDFIPLRVDYFERSSAAGRTPGGYIKRDGRPSDHETLVARLIDRPIRPLVEEGWALETQLAAYVRAAWRESHKLAISPPRASGVARAVGAPRLRARCRCSRWPEPVGPMRHRLSSPAFALSPAEREGGG